MTITVGTPELFTLYEAVCNWTEFREELSDIEWSLLNEDPHLMKLADYGRLDDWEKLLVLDMYRELVATDTLVDALDGELEPRQPWMDYYMDLATSYAVRVMKTKRKKTKKARKVKS